MRGICLDALNPLGRPRPSALRALGVDGVRLVLRDDPMFFSYYQTLYMAGFQIAVVLASESGPDVAYYAARLQAMPPTLWLIGNEPNVTGEASWTMTPQEYAPFFNAARQDIKAVLPTAPCYIGGHFGGDSAWLQETVHILWFVDGIDCHYPQDEAALQSYNKPRYAGLHLSCMEWSYVGRKVTAGQVLDWETILEKYTNHSAVYAWRGDGDADYMMLLSVGGYKRMAYWNYQHALFATGPHSLAIPSAP